MNNDKTKNVSKDQGLSKAGVGSGKQPMQNNSQGLGDKISNQGSQASKTPMSHSSKSGAISGAATSSEQRAVDKSSKDFKTSSRVDSSYDNESNFADSKIPSASQRKEDYASKSGATASKGSDAERTEKSSQNVLGRGTSAPLDQNSRADRAVPNDEAAYSKNKNANKGSTKAPSVEDDEDLDTDTLPTRGNR